MSWSLRRHSLIQGFEINATGASRIEPSRPKPTRPCMLQKEINAMHHNRLSNKAHMIVQADAIDWTRVSQKLILQGTS